MRSNIPDGVLLLSLALFVANPAQAASSSGVSYVYEALGPQAPHVERFEVRPGSVRWLDENGLTLWHLSRSSGMLMLIDHGTQTYRKFDDAGIDLMRGELRAALAAKRMLAEASPSQGKGVQTRPTLGEALLANRPWAALEAINVWMAQETTDEIAGVKCRSFIMKIGEKAVGEMCVADALTTRGGSAVQQLLWTIGQVAERVRAGVADSESIGWPSHPLVAAARTGQLPLLVVERLDGEVRNELRLALVRTLPVQLLEADTAGIPPGYLPVATKR